MKPEFYFDRRSPPVRSVLLLIEALGLDVNYKPIDLAKGEHLSENFIQINPCHTVPTFCDSNVTLTDSHSILIYLCEHYGGQSANQLWPSDSIDRINVLNTLFYSGTLLFRRDSDAIGGIIQNKLRKEQIAEHATKIREQYDILEKYLTQHKFMATDYMTIADISIVTIVSTVDMIVPITADAWPTLHHWWFMEMKALPYYENANGDGLMALKTWVQQSTDFEINM